MGIDLSTLTDMEGREGVIRQISPDRRRRDGLRLEQAVYHRTGLLLGGLLSN